MANEKRLIDANALKSFVCEFCNSINSDEPCEPADCRCMSLIDEMPTVDAVEVVHGRWEHIQTGIMLHVRCTACGVDAIKINTDRFTEVTVEWDYCPNCGAKMDGDDDT